MERTKKSTINVWHFTDPKVLDNQAYLKTDYSSRLYLRLFLVYMFYAIVDSSVSILLEALGISEWKWPEAAADLYLYFLLLYGIYKMVNKIKKGAWKENCEKDIFNTKDLVLIVNRSLLISASYLLLISIFDAPELFRTSAILYITFFVGFAVSLGDIVDCDCDEKFVGCLKKARVEVGVVLKNWKCILLILGALITAVLITKIEEIMLLILLVGIVFICFLLSKIRQVIRCRLYNTIYNYSKERNVLALELCPDKSITTGIVNYLKKKGAIHNKLDSISNAKKNKYDVVIISNALSRTQDIRKNLQKANKYLAEGGVVIAPACISKKKRKQTIFNKLGVAEYFMQPLTKEEYVSQVDGHGWVVQNSDSIYDPTRITWVELRREREFKNSRSDI